MNYHRSINDLLLKVHCTEQHPTDQTVSTSVSSITQRTLRSVLATRDVFLLWLLHNKCSNSNVQGRNKLENNNRKERSHYLGTNKICTIKIKGTCSHLHIPPRTQYVMMTHLLSQDACHCQMVQRTSHDYAAHCWVY